MDLASERVQCNQRRASLKAQLNASQSRLTELQREIRDAEKINSIQLRRERLVRMNWKAMRGPELEGFLGAVFVELGYVVEMVGAAGDQGVDLIATKETYRFAIQSKGYVDSVSNAAVQEAFAGMTYHGCQACVVITNSRFTSSAVELARRTNCTLIDEDRLPALIRGEFDLFEKHFPVERRLQSADAAHAGSGRE
jgi:restriction endonuclease Mrr